MGVPARLRIWLLRLKWSLQKLQRSSFVYRYTFCWLTYQAVSSLDEFLWPVSVPWVVLSEKNITDTVRFVLGRKMKSGYYVRSTYTYVRKLCTLALLWHSNKWALFSSNFLTEGRTWTKHNGALLRRTTQVDKHMNHKWKWWRTSSYVPFYCPTA